MKIIETVISIITPLIGVLLPLFWNRLKGYRTKILSFLTILLGLLTMVSDTILPKLAELFGLSTDSISATLLVLIGFIQYLFRTVTDTPAGRAGELPQRFTADYQSAIQKLKK